MVVSLLGLLPRPAVLFGELGLCLETQEVVVPALIDAIDSVDDCLFEVIVEAELGLVEGIPEVSVIIEPLGDGLEGEAGGMGAWGHDADGGEPIEEDALPRSDGDLPLAGGRSGLVGHESHLSASRGARLSLGAGARALGARLPLGGARQARPRRAFAWRSRTLSLRGGARRHTH